MSSQETTSPLQSTIRSEFEARGLVIRWVHPSVDGPVTALDDGRLILGRGDNCRTRIMGEGVSRYHAEVRVERGGVMIRDLDSTNGVYVNGTRVHEALLHERDVLRLGGSVGVLVAREPADNDPPAFGEPFPGLLAGPVFKPVLAEARAAASTDLPIIIEGETGTGKERVARAIHGWSGRDGALVAINCAALPESLAEAELFGYRKGAFTGADRASLGHFRAADRGTLLLDEIVDLPLALQAKVLRVIEMREVVPLGETRPVPVDVRLVCAAQASLDEAVATRRFRADLLARLDGVTIRLPSLRQRIQEVPFLFAQLAARHSSAVPPLEPKAVEALCRHDWPFNVRELDLLARRVMALYGNQPLLRLEHLPDRVVPAAQTRVEPPQQLPAPVGERMRDARSSPADDERDLAALVKALRDCGGNVTRAAALVGISRPRAYRLMQASSDIDLDDIRSGRHSS